MEFCDLKAQYSAYKEEIDVAISRVIESAAFINGPDVKALEGELAEFCGAKHAIGCANGTDALLIPLMALDIKPGDEILLPDFTFFATAEMPALYGAKPVFVDVDELTYTMDLNDLESKITARTKGIIPVSLYGQCADMDAIETLAKKYKLWVMEDAAQSFGARYKQKKSCGISLVSTTSFFPAKPLGCYGDGGAIFTNDDDLARKMRLVVNHGQDVRYSHAVVGLNARLDTIQAAILRVKLAHFPEELQARQKIADLYTQLLSGFVKTPSVRPDSTSTWAQYTIRHARRDHIAEFLKQKNIPTSIHYPSPLHKQKAMAAFAKDVHCPVSEKLCAEVLSLPMHPFLKEEDVILVAKSIKEALDA